jgi:Carboxypeptidase regulatory-like domain/TonB dependent receptor/TonB-dependent Receptor Plug Domain
MKRLILLLLLCLSPAAMYAQNAEVSGAVQDPSGAIIRKASVEFRDQDTGIRRQTTTNNNGYYHIVGLDPGKYDATVQAQGFKTLTRENIVFQVDDKSQIDFKMQVGQTTESVTVDGSGLTINTTDGSVSTVIERQFVANIPLNGNSFQDLISMTPGVVTESPQNGVGNSSPGSNGDFSINGQRTESNYYMVDGVSANVSAGATTGTGVGGTGIVAATSALGTTQSLLSVDDLQEFRVESSSYSAEYGRSPGGQLSFLTRSGTNTFHGSAFDYFRNGSLDANDWFNDELGQPKNEIHQNDFGGTVGGPVSIPRLYQGKGKTFFFGSYEGLRLVEPVAASVQYVPDLYLREQAPAALQPILNAFPLPTPGGVDYGTPQAPNLAEFFQGYSVPGKIDSSSIRIDQTFTPAFSAFFRFADTPSSVQSRFGAEFINSALDVQTYTLGTTYALSQSITNQFRLGYSRSSSGSTSGIDSFGGAVPIDLGKAMGNTNGITGQTAEASIVLEIPGSGDSVLETPGQNNQQQQWNVTDTFDIVHRAQQWKFGIDFRQISIVQAPPFIAFAEYRSAQSILSNSSTVAEYEKNIPSKPVYNQFALFAQDDWRINSRLSLSGGLRWELAPPPHSATNPQPYTALGDLSNPSSLSLAPDGTPLWHASLGNLAPRLGIAWQANTLKNWATVIRGGGGVFFDTNNETAAFSFNSFGFSAIAEYLSAPMPFTTAQQDISVSVAPPYTDLYVSPSHLQLPYTLEWNTAIEQELGQNNTVTVSYVGSAGRRLSTLQELDLSTINPSFDEIFYAVGVTSDYNALQAKFQRNVSKGVNALVSYTWSHSIDYGSNSTTLLVTRGNSDFDVRQSFQGGLTWELPHLQSSGLTSGLLNGWALDGRLIARTAFPVTLEGNFETDPATGSEFYTNVNLVPNQPIYLYGGHFPGGRSLNPAAFAYPAGTNPGNAPRNFARGFGESQVNFAVRREFPLHDRLHLQFRAEAFNILNHPNFGYVDPNLNDSTFGQATQTLNQSLGTVSSQYQQGGPRSTQFALRFAF